MSAFQAFFLGMVQGLTEFLPVSSSGHLLIVENMLGISADSGELLTLNILLHIGTLGAVFAVYWKRILNMVLHPFQSELRWLIVATIPAVIAALVFDFEDAFAGKFLIWSFYLTAIVLLAADALNAYYKKKKNTHREVRWFDAVAMGAMQAVAILPGLSRSGSTIAGGVATGLSRRRAADFSFLMSIPAILGSAVLDFKDVVMDGAGMSVDLLPMVVGIITALVFGLVAIKGFLFIIRKLSFRWFAVYTALLGTFLLINNYALHWIVF